MRTSPVGVLLEADAQSAFNASNLGSLPSDPKLRLVAEGGRVRKPTKPYC